MSDHRPARLARNAVTDGLRHLVGIVDRHMEEAEGTPLVHILQDVRVAIAALDGHRALRVLRDASLAESQAAMEAHRQASAVSNSLDASWQAAIAAATRGESPLAGTCTAALREAKKPAPKSGCEHCGRGGMMGCPYRMNPEKLAEAARSINAAACRGG